MEASGARANATPPARRGQGWLHLLGLACFVVLGAALYMALLYAPTEAVQGHPQRIFYIHLPLAISSYVSFAVVFVASILYLRSRKTRWDVLARSSAEIGVVFTTLVVITGGIWGQAVWGAFWTWEPRLTFTFILWLIYVSYVMLRSAAGEGERVARYAAVLGIVGFADIPLIFMSVFLWRSLHPQPAGMPMQMAVTLMVSIVAFILLFVYLLVNRLRWDDAREAIEEIRSTLNE